MKHVQTPHTNTRFKLDGAGTDRDLHARRMMVYDPDLGETEADSRPAHASYWMPDEAEASRLDAGAMVELIVHGEGHPPVSLAVTMGVVPQRELIDRGHVDRALGLLYATLRESHGLPDSTGPDVFVELWANCVEQTRTDRTDATDDSFTVDDVLAAPAMLPDPPPRITEADVARNHITDDSCPTGIDPDEWRAAGDASVRDRAEQLERMDRERQDAENGVCLDCGAPAGHECAPSCDARRLNEGPDPC